MFFTACFCSVGYAQNMYVSYPEGNLLRMDKYVDIEGTPYLYEQWTKSNLTLKNGKTFTDIAIRYNLVDDELLFMDPKGQIMAFADPVAQFVFPDKNEKYISGISGLKGFTDRTFFRVFNEGKVKILEKKTKRVSERREFNSATVTKSLLEDTQYFIIAPSGIITPLKRDEKFIFSVLQDKAGPLKEYIKAKKLNLKKDADLVALIDYYNGLPA
jgi:hypothetical protein